MKITDPEIIKNGEIDLIDAVKDDLDLEVVYDILKNRLAASSLSSNGGEIIVHNNQIAFRIDFNVQLSGSLMFDRQGNYIPGAEEETGETDPEDIEPENLYPDEPMTDIDADQTLNQDAILDDDSAGSDLDPAADDDDDLDISLPDYALDDDDEVEEQEYEEESLLEDELPMDDQGDIFDDDENLIDDAPDLSEDIDASPLEDLDESIETDDIEDLDPLPEAEDELLDEDIGDILKESREFWEQKKDS